MRIFAGVTWAWRHSRAIEYKATPKLFVYVLHVSSVHILRDFKFMRNCKITIPMKISVKTV